MNAKTERRKTVLAMEYIARQVNNEDIFYDIWATYGVADGDIPYGELEEGNIDSFEDYYISDEVFKDLMDTFLWLMKKVQRNGGLYCGGITSSSDR